ncbi:hypothetical protein I8748_32020 [Nostoc sp. CENA67]|uniref:Uncharacterized protein n=1 Tax=Amazonocrinis nigriterrae CENA67 TaxID=2794033 RepID=A0A8J7HVQ2_9NOST|nr:hypothetical protein [Amazonocrinis nigriterrae]MBH8566726.1 hypothetical protein [Amazonocrinis nigriterrae CENA67]
MVVINFPGDFEYDKLLPPNNNPLAWGWQDYTDFECQKSKNQAKAQELLDLMTEVSTDAWNAGWMNGTEFRLWEAALGKCGEWGHIQISQETGEKLKNLSDLCGGWWIYHRGERFLSLEEWEKLAVYAKSLDAKEREAVRFQNTDSLHNHL